MISKKEQILETARILFNDHGFTQVSLRNISDQLNISVGNLTYHFRRQDDIIEAHHQILTQNINAELQKMDEGKEPIKSFLNSTLSLYNSMYNYRYFMLEVMYFAKSYPFVAQHFKEVGHLRMRKYQDLFAKLRYMGFMFPESVPGYDKLLIDQLYLHNNFWLSQNVLTANYQEENIVHKGIKEIYGIFLPYLTLAGSQVFLVEMEKLGL